MIWAQAEIKRPYTILRGSFAAVPFMNIPPITRGKTVWSRTLMIGGRRCVSTKELIKKAGIAPGQIAAVSFSAQMMGCLIIDKDEKPIRNMLIWADMRANKQEAYMRRALGMEESYKIVGHRLSASYSAAKLLWIRDNEPENYKRAYKMLHAKDYMILKLTGKIVSDYSDASGTNLFDINTKNWSDEIVKELKIDKGLLPDVHPSTDIAGKVTKKASLECGLQEGTPVVIGGGDGSCACVGAGVVEEGKVYNVVGSSSWISMAAKKPVYDEAMRTFNWIHLDENLYTPCGTMQSAGYSVNWMKNTLCDLELLQARERGVNPYQIIDGKIDKVNAGSGGLLFLPYLLGERSPRWNPNAKGAFIGLTMTSTKDSILRSILEGVGYNLKVILDIFDKKGDISDIIMIGGGAKSKVWLQILSDIWQKRLAVPEYLEEATSMGAAICGGIGVGIFPDFHVIKTFNKVKKTIVPDPGKKEIYEKLYLVFNDAYDALKGTYDKLSAL